MGILLFLRLMEVEESGQAFGGSAAEAQWQMVLSEEISSSG
ncbi:hypothetical protein ACQKP1_03835 [Allorhizobium sp. NPDC080224]|nr:hypothetical protein [Rhizobium rosettiformans]